MVHPPRRAPFAHLDVAGGTGDIAFRDRRGRAARRPEITVLDINADMLDVGARARAKARLGGRSSTFVEANAEDAAVSRQ